MGGHGLYGTVGDYMRFIRMWLNDGAGEHGRVLKPETVAMAEKNGLGDKKICMLPGVIPIPVQRRGVLPRPVEILGAELHGQRRAGADRTPRWRARLGGTGESVLLDRPAATASAAIWATQILPFGDPVSFVGYMNFETALYASLKQQQAA